MIHMNADNNIILYVCEIFLCLWQTIFVFIFVIISNYPAAVNRDSYVYKQKLIRTVHACVLFALCSKYACL